jgi:hypothetical protein
VARSMWKAHLCASMAAHLMTSSKMPMETCKHPAQWGLP